MPAGPVTGPGPHHQGRLTRRAEFVAAAKGRRFHTERMSVQGLWRAEGGLRIGLTVTKKVGHATERNRIKRRLRHALGTASRSFAGCPADVVVVARRDCLAAEYQTLVDDLLRALVAVTVPRAPRRGRAALPECS